MSNYTQPDYRVPVTPGVSVQVENVHNPLAITGPLPVYVENLSDKDDPQRTIRGPKGANPQGR
jgi:hypothetical protein